MQEFQTAGTTETQATLIGISHTGSYTSFNAAGEWEFTNNYSYVSTDYPDSTIKILLQLHYR
ncbi:MAG: hypothetical protein R6V34_05460 [Bacteroidales bacterium]